MSKRIRYYTFKKIDLKGNWFSEVMDCFDSDPCGCFFVRTHRDNECFSLHGHGRAKRDEFWNKLREWSPEEQLTKLTKLNLNPAQL
jgi:hypothetical protein